MPIIFWELKLDLYEVARRDRKRRIGNASQQPCRRHTAIGNFDLSERNDFPGVNPSDDWRRWFRSSGENGRPPYDRTDGAMTLLTTLVFVDPYCLRHVAWCFGVDPRHFESEARGGPQDTTQDHCGRGDAAITREQHRDHYVVCKEML